MMRRRHRFDAPLEVALVNNMPDQALLPTQTQFARLVKTAAQGRAIVWRCYTLPGAERSETARRYLSRSHEDIEALYRRGADALIVSGCEPRAARIADEPYWPHLERLVAWAQVNTTSTIWSCLAAHAAALSLAGVERVRLPQKMSGVYELTPCGDQWFLGRDARPRFAPHSRYNDLPRAALEEKGFRIATLTQCERVDMFWREEPSLFIFLQGHPEYDADTLMKEYRRDVLRWVAGERSDCPELPENYFSPETAARLEALRLRMADGREAAPERALGEVLSAVACEQRWSGAALALYNNWISFTARRLGALRDSA